MAEEYSMDRGIRILGGGVLICLSLLQDAIATAGACAAVIVGMYGLVTGIINYCPLSRLIALEKSRRRQGRATGAIGADDVCGLPFFQNFSAGALQRLLTCATMRDCPAGETVIRAGEATRALFIIVDGACALTVAAEQREAYCCGELGPGDVFGVELLTGRYTSRFSVVTTRPARMLALDRDSLQRLIAADARMEAGILRAALDHAIRYAPAASAHSDQAPPQHV